MARRFPPSSPSKILSNLLHLLKLFNNLHTLLQLSITLFTFTPQHASPYFHGFFPPPNPNSLSWQSLGPIGSCHITSDIIYAHTDFSRPRASPPPPPPRTPKYHYPALWSMALDLVNQNCAYKTNQPATTTAFIKPKLNSTKLRAILDARPANHNQPYHPTKFKLPNISSLKQLLRTHASVFFHHTDIANFYWSFILPPSHSSKFIFALLSPSGVPQNFCLTRPPFGWDYIPTISHSILSQIIKPQVPPNLTSLLYVDDLLTASLISPSHCHNHTSNIRQAITNNNFHIHPPGSKKSSLSPTTSVDFIGKHFTSGAQPSISNLPLTNTTTLFYTLIASTMSLKPKQIQCIAGHLQWACQHNFLSRPFFYSLHRLSLLPPHRTINLHKGTCHSLNTAFFLSSLPWTPSDISIQKPPSHTPLFFCDAAISTYTAACAFIIHSSPHYVSWTLPPHLLSNQQSAELFAIYKTIDLALSLSPSSSICIMSDSVTSLHAVSSFKSGAHSPHRAYILREIALCTHSNSHPIYLQYIPSSHNPADLPSRSLPISSTPSPFHPLYPLSLLHTLPLPH